MNLVFVLKKLCLYEFAHLGPRLVSIVRNGGNPYYRALLIENLWSFRRDQSPENFPLQRYPYKRRVGKEKLDCNLILW